MFERLLARTYDRTINRLDLDATMRSWADDAVFEFPGQTPISGRFEGKAAIRAWWKNVFDRASEVSFVPRHVAFANPFLLTLRNTMFTELEVDSKTKDRPQRASGAGLGRPVPSWQGHPCERRVGPGEP